MHKQLQKRDRPSNSKLVPINNLFELMKTSSEPIDDLLKSSKLIKDDLVDFGDFNQFEKDRSKIL